MGESALPLAAVMPALGSQDAVAGMQKMMQAGLITAGDIAERASARNSMKADLDIRAMQEARAMAPKLAELKKQQTEEALAESKYGPGIKLWQALAPVAGVSQVPKLPDGSTDYATMAEQGGKMAAWMAERQKATEELTPVPGLSKEKIGPDYKKSLVFVNKFGQELTPEYQQGLNLKATRSFSDYVGGMAPGTSSTPGVAPAPGTAALPVGVVQPAGQGGGIDLGIDYQAKMQAEKAAQDKAETVSKTNQALNNAREMDSAVAEGLAIVQNPAAPVGAFQGSEFGQLLNRAKAFFGVGDKAYSEQDKLRGLVGRKVLEGAMQMKGNLSDKDIRFLQAAYPSLGSTRERWVSYLSLWQKMNQTNQQVLQGLLPKGTSVLPDTAAVPPDSEDVGAVVQRLSGAAPGATPGAPAAAPEFATWAEVPAEVKASKQPIKVGGILYTPAK